MFIQRIRMQGAGPFGRASGTRFSTRNPLLVVAAFMLIPVILTLVLALILAALVVTPMVGLGILGARKLGLLPRRQKGLKGRSDDRMDRLDPRHGSGRGGATEAIDVVAEVQSSETLPPP